MSQEIRNRIANNIKSLRTEKKLKREELSLLLGFDNSYISKLERGSVNITIDRLSRIAEYFAVDVSVLLKK
ncbi:helix-turn-helix transcriptional regulator [bacterium]|nr:helix-turn-helix transcriptional regulator [bacterium]